MFKPTATATDSASDELQTIATFQRRELMAAKAIETDLDLAFHLQLQEALTASLSLHSSSSTAPPPQPPPPPDHSTSSSFTDLQTKELDNLSTDLHDRAILEAETRRIRNDLRRRLHDERIAREIARMPEDEWMAYGDDLFRVYFKGLVGEESVGGSKTATLAALGVAICDSRDKLVFEVKKPLVIGERVSRANVECKALIEALNIAVELDLKRIVFYCDYFPIFQYVDGHQQKIVTLVKQVNLLRQKFTFSRPSLIARNDVKFAFKLAREAIVSQLHNAEASSIVRQEACVICLEDTDAGEFFSVDGCSHRYCFSCMKQHVEVKLLHGILPKCPHEGCNLELRIESCEKFLTPKLVDMMRQRMKEASIPVTEKVYCPRPKCSSLISKTEALQKTRTVFAGAEGSGIRICTKCNGHFCINCKVPWHRQMNCFEYKRRNPVPLTEDTKLKNLAAKNLWRQCVKCNHMIELAAGCFHMTCRCGYEFCYPCSSEWKKNKATCECPLWDDRHIMDDEVEDYEEMFDDDDEDDDYYDSDDDDYY